MKDYVYLITALITEQPAFKIGEILYGELAKKADLGESCLSLNKKITGLSFLIFELSMYSNNKMLPLFFANSIRSLLLKNQKLKNYSQVVNIALFFSLNALSERVTAENIFRWSALYALIQLVQSGSSKLVDYYYGKDNANILIKIFCQFVSAIAALCSFPTILASCYYLFSENPCRAAADALGVSVDASSVEIKAAAKKIIMDSHQNGFFKLSPEMIIGFRDKLLQCSRRATA